MSESLFWRNDNYFAVQCASAYGAFHGINVPVMLYALGEGGEGKGLWDIMMHALFGKDISAYTQEFLKNPDKIRNA